MTVHIENRTRDLHLYQFGWDPSGKQTMVMRVSPGEEQMLEAQEGWICFTRVPAELVDNTELDPDALKDMGLDGYIIESLDQGQGGRVNSQRQEAGIVVDDGGIIFTFG